MLQNQKQQKHMKLVSLIGMVFLLLSCSNNSLEMTGQPLDKQKIKLENTTWLVVVAGERTEDYIKNLAYDGTFFSFSADSVTIAVQEKFVDFKTNERYDSLVVNCVYSYSLAADSIYINDMGFEVLQNEGTLSLNNSDWIILLKNKI